MLRTICDYCGEPDRMYTLNKIPLIRRPNDESITAELCDQCLKDIFEFAQEQARKAAGLPPLTFKEK